MITTSGFRLSNLARFTPVDPNLVAFQPTKITEGALDALRLASTLQKYQSDRKKQEEENALQQQRMEAAKAGYGAQTALAQETMALAPARTAGVLADFKVADELRQPKANLEMSLLGSKSKDLAFNEAIRGEVETAKRVEAETAAATAGMSAANKVQQLQLQAAELTDAIINNPKDKDLQRKAKEVDAEYKKALTDQATAAAELSRAKPTIEQNKIAARRELANTEEKRVQNLEKLASDALMQADRIGSREIEDPSSAKSARSTINSLQGRIMEQDDNGNWNLKKGIFVKAPSPQVVQMLKLYQEQLNEAEQYKAQARAARKRLQSALSDEPEVAKKEEAATDTQPPKIRLVLKPDGSLAPRQ